MHNSVMEFGLKWLTQELVTGKRVLEVGSRNINGSLRQHVETLEPFEYIGIDIVPGPGVDRVLDVREAYPVLGQVFDLVICTEMLEHAEDWQGVIYALKLMLREGGTLLLTVRGPGFPKHHEPDFWRFTIEDIWDAFADFDIETIEDDRQQGHPGVLLLAVKPRDYEPESLERISPCASS